MKKLATILVFLALSIGAWGQQTFIPPSVYVSNTTTGIAWTAGTVNNGGHPVAVAAGSGTVTLNKGDCSAPSFANCNFVYANSSGTVAVTTTLATAVASGNSLLAMIETGAVTSTQVVYPWQSGTLWLGATGASATFASSPTITTPVIAGGLTASGAGANDFSGSTGAFKTSTGAVTIGGAITGGFTAAGSGANDFSGSTGAFKTSTGAVTIGGAITGGFTAAGAGANDFSGSTGTFKTSTGVNTFGGSSNTFSGAVTISPTASLDLGTASTALGQLIFNNTSTGSLTVQPKDSVALGSTVQTLSPISGNIPVIENCGSTGTGNQTCTVTAATAKGQIYDGESTLSSNTATITFPNGFTSTTTYFCVANDITTRANVVQMIPASATTATITNTTGGSDVVQWICAGN